MPEIMGKEDMCENALTKFESHSGGSQNIYLNFVRITRLILPLARNKTMQS